MGGAQVQVLRANQAVRGAASSRRTHCRHGEVPVGRPHHPHRATCSRGAAGRYTEPVRGRPGRPGSFRAVTTSPGNPFRIRAAQVPQTTMRPSRCVSTCDRRPRVVPAAGPPAHQTAHFTPRSGLRHQVLTEPRAALLAPHRCGRRVNTRREPSRNRKHSDDCVSSAPIGAEPAAQHATRVDTGDVFARAVSAGGSAIAAGSIINRGLAIIGGLTMAEESA